MSKKERNQLIYSSHDLGLKQTQIAQVFKISQSSVSQILKSRDLPEKAETRGVKPYLNIEQKEELAIYLKQSPQTYGFYSWDKNSIKQLIEQKFNVSYHKNYIYKIMRCINFTSQKPQLRDYRKDEKKVEDFKVNKAPNLKKKVMKNTDY